MHTHAKTAHLQITLSNANFSQDLKKLLCIFEGRPRLYDRVCIVSFYITALQTVSISMSSWLAKVLVLQVLALSE